MVVDRRRLYSHSHRVKREWLAGQLAEAGSLPCGRCGGQVYAVGWLVPEDSGHVVACKVKGCDGECWFTWDLGHPDSGSVGGIEHQACNRSAGGRNGARVVNGAPKMRRREW